ncbi:MAG: transcriptional repressor [Planctomycetaceae bacterium]|nr:transcriptional repressor [Planctomycetaceae bacterium]
MHAGERTIEETLREAGLRVTSGRVALMELLHGSHQPVALDDIDLRRHPAVGDRATVFRNLHAFAEAGIVAMLRGMGKRDLYELVHDHRHAHITCTQCGKTACIDGAPPPPGKKVKARGWSNVMPSLSYTGRCDECS